MRVIVPYVIWMSFCILKSATLKNDLNNVFITCVVLMAVLRVLWQKVQKFEVIFPDFLISSFVFQLSRFCNLVTVWQKKFNLQSAGTSSMLVIWRSLECGCPGSCIDGTCSTLTVFLF